MSDSPTNPDESGEPDVPGMPGAKDTFGLTPTLRPKARLVDPLLGADLGGVRIERLIGEGGMGRVYEATQEKPRRTVAVKVIRQGILSEKTLRRFEREAEFLARLQHPGIAQIFVVGQYTSDHGDVPFYVMEFIGTAKPITNYAHELNTPLAGRLQLFRQVCQAVSHGHDRGIVHRDLKPGNILIDGDGQPKVIDFGVARSTDSDLALTGMRTDTGQVVGTIQYMSPEQFGADPDNLDARADVYALGVVLYELLAGEPPYHVRRKGIHEAARVVCEQPPTPLRSLDKTIPRDVEAIVMRCLEKDRRKRYATAGALAFDLGQVLEGKPISRRPSTSLVDRLAARWETVRRGGLTPVALVVALPSILGLGLWATGHLRLWETREDLVDRIRAEMQPALVPASHPVNAASDQQVSLTTAWTTTRLRVERGGCYRLVVEGDFTDDVGRSMGPDGVAPADHRSLLGPRSGLTRQELRAGFAAGYPRLAVVARIGDNRRLIHVGRELAFIAPESGTLSLRLNEYPSAPSSAAGEASIQLLSMPVPKLVTEDGQTHVTVRVAGEEFLLFEPKGIRWRKSLVGPKAEEDYPVLLNGVAWWPDRFDPTTSALLETRAFAAASGPNRSRPVVTLAPDAPVGARAETVELESGQVAVAFQGSNLAPTDVSCTIAVPK